MARDKSPAVHCITVSLYHCIGASRTSCCGWAAVNCLVDQKDVDEQAFKATSPLLLHFPIVFLLLRSC